MVRDGRSELRQRGWIPDSNDLEILEPAVKDLLGVSDLSEEPSFEVAARRSNAEVSFTVQQTAWLAKVRRLAEVRSVSNFSAVSVSSLAEDLVHRIHNPTDLGQLESWLSDAGVVLVTLLPLRASKLDGASMYLESGTPVIGLTSRGDRMDGYVFTLLHELAHICMGHLEHGAVRTDEEIDSTIELDESESAANQQASEWILPESVSLPEGRPSMSEILEIAQRYRIHTSFVIGRIQRSRRDWGLLRGYVPRVRPHIAVES